MTIKQSFLGTAIGRFALSLRDLRWILRTAYAQPENVGMIANDQIAEFLTTRLCRESKTFLDVGVHPGSFLSEVAHHTPTARIIGFEAIPDTVEQLRRKFPTVEFHSCALAATTGEASFYVHKSKSGFSSLGREGFGSDPEVVAIQVPLQTLDNLVDSDQVDVIKIDVEGAELGVLRGGDRLIARSRPMIMFESGPTGDDGLNFSKEDLWQWFADRQFAVLIPNRVAHNDPGLSLNGFLESHL